MTHAYAESYLDDAMKNLDEAFDYAVNACGLSLDEYYEFMNLFITNGYAKSFENGTPKLRKFSQQVRQISENIQAICFCRFDDAVAPCTGVRTFVGVGKQPVFLPITNGFIALSARLFISSILLSRSTLLSCSFWLIE